MDWLAEFPSLGKRDLRDLKKGIDGSFREWSRSNGDAIEAFFDPLYFFLVWLEKLLIATPDLDFCPLCPLPAVFPLPEPIPLPTRFLFDLVPSLTREFNESVLFSLVILSNYLNHI